MSVIVRMIEAAAAFTYAVVATEGTYYVLANRSHSEDVRSAAVSNGLSILRERFDCYEEPEYVVDPDVCEK